MEKGKISVIIPVYNGVAWLRECVESVLAQTYQNFEVLILDDSSTDGTTQLAQELAAQDLRVRHLLREKNGVSAARNHGLAEAKGEYVTFVDADDKIDAQMLSTLYNFLKKEESDLVLCGYCRWNGEKKENNTTTEKETEKAASETDNPIYCVKTVDKSTYLSEYFLHGNTRCWSILYRRDAIGAVRFRENLTIGEDMMFLADLSRQIKKISITDYKGYFYRMNPNGAMLRPFTPSYMDEIKSWRLAAEIIGRECPEQKARVSSIVAVSAMLVAGKLSVLPAKERRRYQDYITECRQIVQEFLQEPGARKELPPGYKVKTGIFTACPVLYLGLYHLWKRS